MTEQHSHEEQRNQKIAIEKAFPNDAEEVSELIRRTWMATYPNAEAGISSEDIRLRTEGKHGERISQNIENWRKRIETDDGTMAVFVARDEGKIVGMASTGINKEDGKHRIYAMYVAPDKQGLGVGGKLMQKSLEWLGEDEDIYLVVASYNKNAINFYKRFDFEETDTQVIDQGNVYGNTRIPEIEMVRRATID